MHKCKFHHNLLSHCWLSGFHSSRRFCLRASYQLLCTTRWLTNSSAGDGDVLILFSHLLTDWQWRLRSDCREIDLAKPWLARLSVFFFLRFISQGAYSKTMYIAVHYFPTKKNYLAYEGLSSAFISPLVVVQVPPCYSLHNCKKWLKNRRICKSLWRRLLESLAEVRKISATFGSPRKPAVLIFRGPEASQLSSGVSFGIFGNFR